MVTLDVTAATLLSWLPPSTAPTPTTVPSLVQTRQSLLRYLVVSALATSSQTALFLAERLHAIEPTSEPNAFLLAAALAAVNQPLAALHTLNQAVTFTPASASTHGASSTSTADGIDDWTLAHAPPPPPPPPGRPTATTAAAGHHHASRVTKPAVRASLRADDGRAVLGALAPLIGDTSSSSSATLAHQTSSTAATPLAPADPQADIALAASIQPAAACATLASADSAALALEQARLARADGQRERAIQAYRFVLGSQPWCWEAIESLCALGAPPDPDGLFPPRPRPPANAVPISPLPQHTLNVQARSQHSTSHPPPLGPSQTLVVNSTGVIRTRSANGNDGLGFFTPVETTVGNGKRADIRGPLFPQNAALRKPSNKLTDLADASLEDRPPGPLSFGPTSQTTTGGNGSNTGAGSLFTPPSIATLATTAAPGVKRNRAGTPQNLVQDDDSRAHGGRAADNRATRESAAMPRPMRRSSRLSKDTNTVDTGSRPMVMSRSQQASLGPNQAGRSTRDKKRSKAGSGPAILSDVSSEVLSPTSHSSSPVPSSPGAFSLAQAAHGMVALPEAAVQDAEDYVANVLRSFGRAASCAAKFESAKCIEACQNLPLEQQKTWRSYVFVAKAQMDLLNYEKAERAFSQARQTAPYLVESMETFSTLLWHMKNPTALSCLAQDLMLIAPKSAAAWIAAGNVFSHLEDHTAALKCFQRAAQVDRSCVYAVTLSGHECVALEDFGTALNFFREAIRLDERHFNAWFGIGNVYMQSGQFRLAEFHFRRAAEINPSNATLLCCVGTVLEKQRETRNALVWYERACVLAPESPAVRFKRVRILIALKQYELAESDLIALRDRAPNEFNVHYLLGKLYKTLKRTPEMLKHFGLAQDIEPRMASLIREQIENDVDGMDVDEHASTSG
ncbi:anaphase-promoting complex subunit cdc27 [Microbotryomycetes sp. JL201]|nr:anaphase-promoting complex subunit cdc27 [Microbotryomycetes sp. JL201]